MKLAQFALIMAVFMAGLAITLKRLGDFCGIEFPEITHFLIYAPAVALGTLSWLTRPSLLAHWSIVLITAIPVIGVFYGESPSRLSSAVIVFYILSGPAIASLIVEYRRWLWTARWTVLVNALVVLLVFYLNYQAYHGSLYHIFVKFGFLPLNDQTFGANPNQMGGQFAFASVLGLVLFLRSSRSNNLNHHKSLQQPGDDHFEKTSPVNWSHPQGLFFYPNQPNIGRTEPKHAFCFGKADWLVLLATFITAVGCLMTGSRGGAFSLFIGSSIVVFGSAGLQPLHRLRDLMAATVLLLLASVLLTAVFGINPVPRLIARFTEEDIATVSTAGNRLSIWENVIRAWTRDPGRILAGTGTGGADVALGELDPGATWDDSGTLRRNCHNAFLEWLLSYGIIGIVPGILFVAFVLSLAIELDHAEGTTLRTGLLAALFAFAMTAVNYRHLYWPIEAGLVLAILCGQENHRESGSGPSLKQSQRFDVSHQRFLHPASKTCPGSYQKLIHWPIYW
jgi:O-antigen ligase